MSDLPSDKLWQTVDLVLAEATAGDQKPTPVFITFERYGHADDSMRGLRVRVQSGRLKSSDSVAWRIGDDLGEQAAQTALVEWAVERAKGFLG